MGRFLTVTYIWARRCVVATIGGTVVLIGVLMIVLPGPAIVVIPAGLAILGLEFACARRWLRQLRTTGNQVFTTTFGRFFGKGAMRYRPIQRAHAAPPFASPQLAQDRCNFNVKANTKTNYYPAP